MMDRRPSASNARQMSLLMLVVWLAGTASANWTATGSFNYTNRLYASGGYTTTESRPIRQADVDIIDVSTGAILASGTTGYDGSYSIAVADSSTRSVATRVLSASERTNLELKVVDPTASNAYYALQSATAVGHSPSASVNFGAVTAPGTIGAVASVDPTAGAFNAFDMGLYMADWVKAMSGSRPTRARSRSNGPRIWAARAAHTAPPVRGFTWPMTTATTTPTSCTRWVTT